MIIAIIVTHASTVNITNKFIFGHLHYCLHVNFFNFIFLSQNSPFKKYFIDLILN